MKSLAAVLSIALLVLGLVECLVRATQHPIWLLYAVAPLGALVLVISRCLSSEGASDAS
jgi:hypothetical protein